MDGLRACVGEPTPAMMERGGTGVAGLPDTPTELGRTTSSGCCTVIWSPRSKMPWLVP